MDCSVSFCHFSVEFLVKNFVAVSYFCFNKKCYALVAIFLGIGIYIMLS